jgi:2-polyprenyl-3-methyl-5-hydroxy-6-metoxy-1,4-benzoquinol methylase
LGVTHPFPSTEQSLQTNLDTYNSEQRIQLYLTKIDYFKKRYRRYLQNIRKYKSHGKLLDVGCNIGLFLVTAKEEGFEATGIELNKECADYAENKFGLDIVNDYLENKGFQDGIFDIVTMFDVLEHIPDMRNALGEVRRVLKKDGLLVVQLPNLDSVMARLTGSKWVWFTTPDHLYHFNPKNLSEFLLSNGFKIEHLRTWEPSEDFSGNIIQSYCSNGIFGKALKKILRLSSVVLLATRLLRPFWWRKRRGGLIEVYASKV